MNHYSSLEDLKNYRDSPAVSQSLLKAVLNNTPYKFKPSVQMVLGSCLDCFLTSPQLEQDLFCVGLENRPSEAISNFIDVLWKKVSNNGVALEFVGSLEDYKDELILIAREANYQANWKDEALWKALEKDGARYWEELIKCEGKTIVSAQEWNTSKTLAELCKDSHITGKYFIEQENVDKYYQYPLFWFMEDIECKGLSDVIIVEHETKTIYLVDVKGTDTSGLKGFMYVAKSKNYPFQLSWYKEGILRDPLFKKYLEGGYTLEFRWLVIPFNTERFRPWKIPVSDKLLEIGKTGFSVGNLVRTEISTVYFKQREGWKQALAKYKASLNLNGGTDFDEWLITEGNPSVKVVEQIFFG